MSARGIEAFGWSVTNTPAVAAQATVTRPAVAGVGHVCVAITVSVASGATPSGVVVANLRDSTSGAGNVLWSAALSCPAQGSSVVTISGLGVAAPNGNALTLEFAAGGAATSQQSVSMQGFDQSE